ncbi:MAG: hypothetical protein HY297_01270 [Thaumarchaeota archaeon]|nr:hypothetical protein [Nitrososphaerota archaeon]
MPLPVQAVTSSGAFFTATVVAPTSNPLRRQWAAIVTNNLKQLNIDARLIYVSFGVMSGLTFGCSADNCGKTYDQGGFDIHFVGYGGGTPLPDFGTQNQVTYRSLTPADYAPTGGNYYFYHNDTFNQLAVDYNNEFNATARIPIAQQMVRIVAQDKPDMPIFYGVDIYGIKNYLNPWGSNQAEGATTANRDFAHWSVSSGTEINIAETGDINSVNQWVNPAANTYYDAYLYNPTAASLEEVDARTLGYFNALATSITSSSDHLTWDVGFRAHTFQDGVTVTSDAYLFAVMGSLVTQVGYVGSGTLQGLLGDFGRAGACNCSQVQFTYLNGTSDYVVDGAYSHVNPPGGFTATSVWTAVDETHFRFTLSQPYLFTDPILTGIAAAPMHVFEELPFATWANSCYATLHTTPCPYVYNLPGQANHGGNGTATAYGPVGDGPYFYHGYDVVTETGTLVKWPGYWNASGLEGMGLFNAQTIHVVHILNKDNALAAFANGQVNFLDANYQINPSDFSVLTGNGGTGTQRASPGAGFQMMAVQNTHPILGTGTGTPLGQATPSRAAEAARYVRAALSHAIPRQYIIDNLLQGVGTIGITEFCSCFGFAYASDVTPDSFDLTLASQLLAQAGYTTSGGGVTPITPPEISCTAPAGQPGGAVSIPSFLSGNTLALTGTFAVVPATGAGTGGFYATLQESTDGGTTWEPVAMTLTSTGGYYTFGYTPGVTGDVWYRVFFTGVSYNALQALAPSSPSFPEGYTWPQSNSTSAGTSKNGLPQLNSTDVQYSQTTHLTVGSLAQVIQDALASLSASDTVAIHSAVCSLATSTNLAISELTSSVNTRLDALAAKSDTLNTNLNTLSYIAYAALAVAIILGLVAIALSRKKAS